MLIETPGDAGTPERFVSKERDLIRREFMMRWGGARSLHEGFFLRRWGSGPQKGSPKVGATIRSMLARGLVEIVDPQPGFPFARFTPAGIAALRAMAQHRGMLPPDQYGHLIEELETLSDPRGRRQRAPKAAARSELVSKVPREPQSSPRSRRAVGMVENPAFQEGFASLFAGIFGGKPTRTAKIIQFQAPAPAAQKPKPRR